MTTYNQWWVDNIPYVETPEHNIDKTVFYRWWLSRFNMLDANMPGNTFQYPTSIEGVLGYNNQIVLTSGMFINDTKWFRNAEYSYGTWVSAGRADSQERPVRVLLLPRQSGRSGQLEPQLHAVHHQGRLGLLQGARRPVIIG